MNHAILTVGFHYFLPGLRLPPWLSPDGATCKRQHTSDSSLLLIYRPRKDERRSWPSWLTCSGRFTHISGHPLAAGRAHDRESSPVRDRRSTTVPRHQLCCHATTGRLKTDTRNNAINKLSPRGRRDDMLPADGSSTRGGSTSVRGRVRSPHTSGGGRWLSCRQPSCL